MPRELPADRSNSLVLESLGKGVQNVDDFFRARVPQTHVICRPESASEFA